MSDSLRPYLKFHNLFVRELNREASLAVVKSFLEKLCPNGKVVLPVDHGNSASHIGTAYLNFNSPEEAEVCLQKYRFSIKFKGVEAKLMYAAIDKDRVYGPFSLKFQVIIKNLSEEVDARMLYDLFIPYGEIYQCKVDNDVYNQHYGQLTFMDMSSVPSAVQCLNQTRWHNSVIVVEPHHKAHLSLTVAGPPPAAPSVSSTTAFPSLGSSSSGSAAATRRLSSSSSSGGVATSAFYQQPAAPPSRFSSQEQQEQHQHTVFEPSPVNFALSASSTGLAAPAPFPQPMTSSSTSSARDGGAAAAAAAASFPGDPEIYPAATSYGNGVLGSVTSTPAGAAAAGPNAPLLLQLLDRRRAEAAAAAAATAAAAGAGGNGSSLASPSDQQVTGAGLVKAIGAPGSAVGTPTGAGGAGPAKKPKGGILKSVMSSFEQLSDMLCCPITHEVFQDPVLAADGVTYERSAIAHWLSGHDTSPMTNTPLLNKDIQPNNLVKAIVKELM